MALAHDCHCEEAVGQLEMLLAFAQELHCWGMLSVYCGHLPLVTL